MPDTTSYVFSMVLRWTRLRLEEDYIAGTHDPDMFSKAPNLHKLMKAFNI